MPSLRSQRGGMLVEVMMSALLVAMAATAVFKGIDGATATSAQSKSRAVATNLAQEDQERLRAMDPRKLASYSPSPVAKTVNRVAYTVTSTAAWLSDRGESESCTKGDGRVVYMQITSKVTWPEMGGSKPVSASSLVAISNAYAKGSLGVKVQDRDAAPVPGVGVALDAPASVSNTTNDRGCVVFDGLTPGSHFGQLTKTGYVDMNGQNAIRPVNGWSVSTGATSIATYVYDQAGSAAFNVVTKVEGTDYPLATAGVVMSHPQIPGPPTPQQFRHMLGTSSDSFTGLFPFNSAYTAYAIGCAGAQPPSTGSGPGVAVTVPRGGAANSGNAITLRMPSVNVKVTLNGGLTGVAGMDIKIRPATTNPCASALPQRNWLADATGAQSGRPAADRGFPPGNYIVCVDDNASSPRGLDTPITVGTGDYTHPTAINVKNSSGSGRTPNFTCP